MRSDNPYGADQVKRSLSHFIVGKGASAIIGLALLLLLVRVLSPADYGIYIALLALLEITQLGSNFGLFAAAYRYVPELRSKNQGVALFRLLMQLCLGRLITLLIAAILIFYAVQWIVNLVGITGQEQALIMYLVVIVGEGFARYVDVLFDSLLLQGYSQVCILFRNLLRLVGLLILLYRSEFEMSLIIWIKIEMFASVSGAILSSTQLIRYARKIKLIATDSSHNHSIFHKYFSYTGPSYLGQIVFLIYGPDTVKLIITKVLGVMHVGSFGFAAAFVTMLQRYMPMFLLLGMVRPLFVTAQLQPDKDAKLNQLSNMILKLNLFILGPMLAYFIVCGDMLAKILSGGKFPDAGGLMVAFIFLLIIQTWNAVLSLLAIAAENGFSVLNGTILGLVGLALGLCFLPRFGIYSMCFGLITSEFIRCLYMNKVMSTKGVKVNWDWFGLAKILLASLFPIEYFYILDSIKNNNDTVYLLSNMVNKNDYIFLSVNFITVSFLFLMITYLLKPFTPMERGIINKVLPCPVFVW